MIKASHYVFKSMHAMLGKVTGSGEFRGDPPDLEPMLSNVRNEFDKFSLRYKNDEELQGICDEFDEYLKIRDEELVDRISMELEELMYLRRLGSLVSEMRSRGERGTQIAFT